MQLSLDKSTVAKKVELCEGWMCIRQLDKFVFLYIYILKCMKTISLVNFVLYSYAVLVYLATEMIF